MCCKPIRDTNRRKFRLSWSRVDLNLCHVIQLDLVQTLQVHSFSSGTACNKKSTEMRKDKHSLNVRSLKTIENYTTDRIQLVLYGKQKIPRLYTVNDNYR